MGRRPRLARHGDTLVLPEGFFGLVLTAPLDANFLRPFVALLATLRGLTRSAKSEITVKVIRLLGLRANVEISEDSHGSKIYYIFLSAFHVTTRIV